MADVSAAPQSPWVVRPRPNAAARARVFCFAHAGGGASAYRPWATDIAPDVEVCGVQLPGRESRWREPRFRSVSEVVPAIVRGLEPWLDRPFAMFGHSLGALLAFETAHALQEAGRRAPAHLFASAHRAPHRANPHPPMRHLADQAFIDEMCRRYGGVPKAVLESPELLALMLPCLRDDFTMFETYVHQGRAPLGCPITALGGDDDRFVTREELAGWSDHTAGAFAIQQMPGDHFYLQDRRADLARLVTMALGRQTAVEDARA
jgi:surfactin synthase thioesterase subunit